MGEKEEFGRLVRTRREAMRMSQEALAAEALGNADRKGYISEIENGLRNIKPATARRLAEALEIGNHEVPTRYVGGSPVMPRPGRTRILSWRASSGRAR